MQKIVLAFSLALIMTLGGCFGSSNKSEEGVSPAMQSEASAATKSEKDIRAELHTAGQKLVAQAARTITPKKSKKAVHKSSHGYTASYVEIEQATMSTEMKPSSKAGQYVGFVLYQEKFFECHGKNTKEALAAPCKHTRTRQMKEMIHYDGKKWRY